MKSGSRSLFRSLNQKNKIQRLASCQITELNQPTGGGGTNSEDKQRKKKRRSGRRPPSLSQPTALGLERSRARAWVAYWLSRRNACPTGVLRRKVASNHALLTPTHATCRIGIQSPSAFCTEATDLSHWVVNRPPVWPTSPLYCLGNWDTAFRLLISTPERAAWISAPALIPFQRNHLLCQHAYNVFLSQL